MIVLCVWRCGTGLAGVPILLGFMFGTFGIAEFIFSVLFCRPQTQGEEELQLQLALAMSREEADAEETKKKSDDMRLTLAIQKSKEEVNYNDLV